MEIGEVVHYWINCGVCGGDNSSCEGIDCIDNTSVYCQDLSVLQDFIDNSQGGVNPPPSNLHPLNLGEQIWKNGRLQSLCVSKYCPNISYKLSGQIPTSIGNLKFLDYLNLESNMLTGEIPPEIGNLGFLTYINLNNNYLTGNIPSEIGNLLSLEQFEIGVNYITGEIPPEIGNLLYLRWFGMYNCDLTGEIPPEIGNLVFLEHFRFNIKSNFWRNSI